MASLKEAVLEGSKHGTPLPGQGVVGSGGPLKVVVPIVTNVSQILKVKCYYENCQPFLLPVNVNPKLSQSD